MLKLAIEIFFGIIATIAGFYSAFLFLKSQEAATNFFFLIPVIPLIFIGIKLLFKATEAIKYEEAVADPLANLGSPENTAALEKNQELLDEWRKTTTNESKLKMLKLKDSVEDEMGVQS